MKPRTIKTQFGQSAMADFKDYTWTFLMNKPFRVVSGDFAIVDKRVYDALLKSLADMIEINGTELTALIAGKYYAAQQAIKNANEDEIL